MTLAADPDPDDTTETTEGVYRLSPAIIDTDDTYDAMTAAQLPLVATNVEDAGFVTVAADTVPQFAAGTADEQAIHVGDIDMDNIVNGALTLSWLLDTLHRADITVKEVSASFTGAVQYDADGVTPVRAVDASYTDDDDQRINRYLLQQDLGDDPVTAVDLVVDRGEPGANPQYETDITPRDFAQYISYGIGAFFDRAGDVLLGVEDAGVYTPFDEADLAGGETLDRTHIGDIEEGPLYEAFEKMFEDSNQVTIRRYHNDIRPVDSGDVDAKFISTVLETDGMDDMYALFG